MLVMDRARDLRRGRREQDPQQKQKGEGEGDPAHGR
jgi:hypothetical protein